MARFGTYLGMRSRGFVMRVDVRVKERKESRIIHFLAWATAWLVSPLPE